VSRAPARPRSACPPPKQHKRQRQRQRQPKPIHRSHQPVAVRGDLRARRQKGYEGHRGRERCSDRDRAAREVEATQSHTLHAHSHSDCTTVGSIPCRLACCVLDTTYARIPCETHTNSHHTDTRHRAVSRRSFALLLLSVSL
jgi:hypothetical protein